MGRPGRPGRPGHSADRWPVYAQWAPTTLIAAGVIFDLLTPIQYSGGPLVAVACVAAGATLPLRSTAAVCAFTSLAVLWLAFRHGLFGPEHGGAEVANVVIAALAGLEVNRVIRRYGRRLEAVSTVAEAAQRAVVPMPPERIGPLTVAAVYRAAQSEARIGGDAYAVEDTPYGVRLLIADVRGKGLEAVGAVSVLLGAFREASQWSPDLGALAGRLEQALVREARRRNGEELQEGFVTALLGEFDPDGSTVRLLNRGHPAPYLLQASAPPRPLDASAPDLPLCLGPLGEERSAPDSFALPPGATLLLVTDGVTEARNKAGAFYDARARLTGRGPFARPQDAVDTLMRDVERWTSGRRADDMAVLAVTHGTACPEAFMPSH
ncbi:serine/threonine-protein phosphatase [Streptomyces sp. RB6PN25]|uniref:Serine/threonine-protein phosphatase n=1 Tax=Streptomyces humicola TaxID=2953240 RepID=A0ABT1PXW6_9ACTN|nr:PP2C family protein-serine/threonine phosphatase [Streptomyces humicola]MCQ4082511.1 serine/threonine-protein phosphatase [Streptomyces humicola]